MSNKNRTNVRFNLYNKVYLFTLFNPDFINSINIGIIDIIIIITITIEKFSFMLGILPKKKPRIVNIKTQANPPVAL